MPSRLPALVTQLLDRCGIVRLPPARFTSQEPAAFEPPNRFCEPER